MMDGSKRVSNIGMKYDAQIFSLKLDEDACYPFQSFICFIKLYSMYNLYHSRDSHSEYN